MLSVALENKRITLGDGRSACCLEWRGEHVLIDDSASNALDIFLLFSSDRVPEQEKATSIIKKMFIDPDAAFLACDYSMQEFGKLINHVTREIFGIETDPNATPDNSPELFDVEQDAAAIRASLRMAYGIDWDSIRDVISWAEFLTLLASLPFDTPLGMRMYYRDKTNRPKPDKHNREQVKEFDKYASLFALDKKTSSHDKAKDANSAMTDMALSLAALA